jgi:hypothetical protein
VAGHLGGRQIRRTYAAPGAGCHGCHRLGSNVSTRSS